MLSTLLPGIRELRAPLAAGYMWLLAGWIALEPHIPAATSATGLIASVYRLDDALSGFGLAVAASFAAYLIGSLSMTLFSSAIRGRFIDVPRSAVSLGPLAPLSAQGTSALSTLTRRTVDQMAASLALTDLEPGDVLELEGIASEPASAPLGASVPWQPQSRLRRLLREPFAWLPRTVRFSSIEVVLSYDQTSDLDARQRQLVRRVVSEFDQIIGTRLLGRDPDLFSAVDRHRAEVEFRVAVIPPLAVLTLAVSARVDLWAIALVVVAGLLSCLGLFMDARERERKANDTLAGALVDGRVHSPTLQALEQRTSMIAKQPRTEKMQQAAVEAVRAIGELIDLLDRIDSNLTRAGILEAKLNGVRDRTAAIDEFFAADVVGARDRAIAAIREASKAWSDGLARAAPEELDRARKYARDSKTHYVAFRHAAGNEIEHASAEPMPSTGAGPPSETEPSARMQDEETVSPYR
jgi:hypothetical protein